MLDLKNAETEDEKSMPYSVFNSTAFEFFSAGFETSSTLMSYALFELAQNQEIQGRLREEIAKSLKQSEGCITYESLNDMKYLDKVVKGK